MILDFIDCLKCLVFHTMDIDFDERSYRFRCSTCDDYLIGSGAFTRHIRYFNHQPPFKCGQEADCANTFLHVNSLIRHIRDNHVINIEEPIQLPAEQPPLEEVQPVQVIPEVNDVNPEEDIDDPIDLQRSAANLILTLRQTGGVTSALIERFQDACNAMVQDTCTLMKQKVLKYLDEQGVRNSLPAVSLVRELNIENPFQSLRTMKQQLHYFAAEMGLVPPETNFIGYRTDFRLDSVSNQYEPTQVMMTFEYIPIIKTLTLVLSNPKLRGLIQNEKASEDGIMRSYLDGSRCKQNALVVQHSRIIRLQLYVDDLDLVNPLGSRTTIHKVMAFYFSIQNLPPEESSQLSSIYLLCLAYSEDIKHQHDGFATVLYPFLQDLKKLESPEGVTVRVGDELTILRANLTLLCADTLAAHEILGFLSPSARHFCRKCMVSRQEFHTNCSAVGEQRTKESFNQHIELVKERPAFSTECGVAKDCPLHNSATFSATDDAPFDIFHDLLEGVCHLFILLALRSFVCESNFFSVDEFNERVSSFNYGIPDRKNKPSANFTRARLAGKHFLQKGSQTWCLVRVFGFLVPEVSADNQYLKLVNLLQESMLIIFSSEIRPEDIDKLESLIEEILALYQQLCIGRVEDLDDVIYEEEVQDYMAGNVHPVPHVRVSPINKLHHLRHYPDLIRAFGPLVRFWCIRYEARHHIFCKYASVCCNFLNVPKSMAQMHQISTLLDLISTTPRLEEIEVKSGLRICVENSPHVALLVNLGLKATDIVSDANAAMVGGQDFRPNLFVVVDANLLPVFGIIRKVYFYEGQLYFVVLPWYTETFEKRYCAYHVKPNPASELVGVKHQDLRIHQAFAPWNPLGKRTVYISTRTIIF